MQAAYAKLLIIAVLFLSAPIFSAGAEDENDIRKRLAQSNFIRGDFTQERALKGIARPIKSKGRYAIWRNKGIYWETNQPLFQATSFLQDCVYYWSDENSFSRVEDGAFHINEKISQLMLAFFTADFEQLGKSFRANWQTETDLWSVVLTPENDYIGKAIKQVTINGAQHIEMISLLLATGDSTIIWLNVSGEADEPDTESENKIIPDKTRCK